MRYWRAYPQQAPAPIRDALQRLTAVQATVENVPRLATPEAAGIASDVFNLDSVGLPQNEESVTVCRNRPEVVLGATNDFRGFLRRDGNTTGWHFSADAAVNVANEGALPALPVGETRLPSGGDPVVASDAQCNLYAGSLNASIEDPFGVPNAVGIYRSTPERLLSCPGAIDPSCWPVRRTVATAAPQHFLDKEWLDVGRSGAAGTVVWVVFADISLAPGGRPPVVEAVRCDAQLTQCTQPIRLSPPDTFAQLADVTIGPDGRTYVAWFEFSGLGSGEPRIGHVMRVAEPAATSFGPLRRIGVEPLPGPMLHADDFRVPPSYGKNAVTVVNGRPRVFFVWEGCRARALGFSCEEPAVKLQYSDDLGVTWSGVRVLSVGGDNYFPTIAADPTQPLLAVAWFTNRFDDDFHHRQDVELVRLDASTVVAANRQRLTSRSNEPDADPFVGGTFIGDYIEVAAHRGIAYVHFNANYRELPLAQEGFPVAQQDNYRIRRPL